jgi:ABC-type maltose transport system permease subunit
VSPLALHTLDALNAWLIGVAIVSGVVAVCSGAAYADTESRFIARVALVASAVCFTMVSLIVFLPTSKSLRETKALCECRGKS